MCQLVSQRCWVSPLLTEHNPYLTDCQHLVGHLWGSTRDNLEEGRLRWRQMSAPPYAWEASHFATMVVQRFAKPRIRLIPAAILSSVEAETHFHEAGLLANRRSECCSGDTFPGLACTPPVTMRSKHPKMIILAMRRIVRGGINNWEEVFQSSKYPGAAGSPLPSKEENCLLFNFEVLKLSKRLYSECKIQLAVYFPQHKTRFQKEHTLSILLKNQTLRKNKGLSNIAALIIVTPKL